LNRVFQKKDNKIKELSRLGEKKEFDDEKVIQNLIEENLSSVFPSLEFLVSELTIGGLRPDSIAYDHDRNAFVVIEYKNVEHKGVIDQGMSYRKLIMEKLGEFILLYHKIKGKVLDPETDVNLDETRVVFISPTFTVHQKRAIQGHDLPIELYEIARYENEIITLNKIEQESSSSEKKSKSQAIIRLQEYSEEDFLDMKYHEGRNPLSPQMKQFWYQAKNRILEENENLEYHQKKLYGGFYSKLDGSAVCTFDPKNTKILLSYTTRQNSGILSGSSFVRLMIKEDGNPIGHWGMGDYQSELKTEADLEMALPLIKKVYDSKTLRA